MFYDEMKTMALQKLEEESKSKPNETKASAFFEPVIEALKNFAEQDGEFAQAIVQNDQTVADCCISIGKNAGNRISDLEVFKKAVAFYFPGATVKFQMEIELCPSTDNKLAEAKKPTSVIDITDLL